MSPLALAPPHVALVGALLWGCAWLLQAAAASLVLLLEGGGARWWGQAGGGAAVAAAVLALALLLHYRAFRLPALRQLRLRRRSRLRQMERAQEEARAALQQALSRPSLYDGYRGHTAQETASVEFGDLMPPQAKGNGGSAAADALYDRALQEHLRTSQPPDDDDDSLGRATIGPATVRQTMDEAVLPGTALCHL